MLSSPRCPRWLSSREGRWPRRRPPRRSPPAAPAAAPTASSAVDPHEPAQVYIYTGHTFWPGGSQAGIGPSRWDITEDGGPKVLLSDTRTLEFDTPPGKHRFTRYAHGLIEGGPASIDLDLAPGEEVYLRLNLYLDVSPATLQNGERLGFATNFLFDLAGVAAVTVAAAVGSATETKPHDHPYGVWLVREPPPPEDAPALTPAKPPASPPAKGP